MKVAREEGVRPPSCQKPFVNVFKHYAVEDWKTSQKAGQVELVMDKIIGKKVFRIVGNVLASNYIKVPTKATQSLSLTGRYLFTQIRAIPEKYFVLHVYVLLKNDTVLDVSISNLYKEWKRLGNVLQVPCNMTPKWTTLCVDLVDICHRHHMAPFKHLKALQVCSNLFIRNMFTSDNFYQNKDLPRDFCFPSNQGRDESLYEFHVVPEAEMEEGATGRSVTETENTDPQPNRTSSDAVKRSQSSGREPSAVGRTQSSGKTQPPAGKSVDVTMSSEKEARPAAGFQPDPAMELRWCIGYTGGAPGSIIWTRDCRSIVYPCSHNAICLNPDTAQQKFFFGHSATVAALALSPNDTLLATCQAGKNPMIRLWEVATGECVALVGAYGSDVQCIDFNRDETQMVAVGKEDKGAGRNFLNLMVIWDVSRVTKGGKAVKLVEHSFEPSLIKVRFAPFEEGRLVSCGAENIQLWRKKRVRDKFELRRMLLALGPHANQRFLDLAFEGALGGADLLSRKIYASTESGLVYQINYTNKVVDQIYRLHGGAINALVVTDGFCVTGSSDRFLRVWPLDFSDFFLEAEHAAPVTALSVSSDCLRIAIGTLNGTIGVMDVPSHGYRTVVRSHESVILALAMDPHNREFTTAAADGTIRTWDLDSYDQLCEFVAPGERAGCVVYHPKEYVIASGFDDGAMRVFDIGSTTELQEYRQHQGRVVALSFTPDGSKLFSAATDGLVCVYDAVRNYQPIKTIVSAHAGDDMSLALSLNGRFLASLGVGSASALVFDTQTMDKCKEISANGRTLRLLQFAPIKNELFAITRDRRLHRYDLESGELAHESASLHLDVINSMDLSENGKFLLTASNDGLVKLWALGKNGPSEKRCQSFIGHPAEIMSAQFSPDRKQVVSVGNGCGIFVWDLVIDTSEDVSVLVDRLIDERIAEQSRFIEQAERAETPPPKLPIPPGSQAVTSLLKDFREKLKSEDTDSELEAGGIDQDNVQLFPSEPSPLLRVRERAMNLDLSTTPVSQSPHEVTSVPSMVEPERYDVEVQPTLPAKHYLFRRLLAKRAERTFVASEDLAGLRMVRMIGCNPEAHDGLVWHPGSGFLAMAAGSAVVVEDLETREQQILQGHDDEISTMALSDDGVLLASGSGFADGIDAAAPIFVWDCIQGNIYRRLDFHHRGVQAMAWSQDAKHLVSVGNCEDGKLVLWDVDNNSVVAAAECPQPVHAVRFCGPMEFVTVGYANITFWLTTEDGKLHMQEKAAPNEQPNVHYTCLDMGLEGRTLFVGSSSGSVSQWELSAEWNMCTGTWQTSQGELSTLHCHGDRVVTCGQNPHVRIWEHVQGEGDDSNGDWQVIREINLDAPPSSLTLDAEGNEGVASTTSGTVWHVGAMGVPATRIGGGHSARVQAMEFSESGDMFASCAADGAVMLWAVRGMELLQAFPSSTACNAIAFSPSGRSLAAGYADGIVREMELGSALGTSSDAFLVHSSAVTVVQYAHGGDAILCGSAEGALSCAQFRTGDVRPVSCIVPAGAPICCLSCAPDNQDKWLVTASNGTLSVFKFDGRSGRSELLHKASFQHQATLLAQFSPTQSNIVVCAGAAIGAGVYYYDLNSQQVVKQYVEMDHVATTLAVSPSGHLITIGTDERLVKVVDYEEGAFQDFTGHSDAVSALCFSPTGNALLSAAHTDMIYWEVCV